MALEAQLKSDMKDAMKARDKVRLGTIKMLLADLKNQQIAAGGELSEGDELTLLARQAKQRREAQAEYERGNRPELAAQEAAELVIIEGYLPRQLTPDEVRAIIAEIVAATGATSKREMGKVMGPLMSKVKGRFPGSDVKALVEEALS